MSAEPDLAGLIGSRICHDLISPLGAIGNGLELLAMTGLDSVPEIALIAESAEQAAARIRLYRIAYGAAPPEARIPGEEAGAALADAARGGRIAQHWEAAGELPRAEVRLAVLLVQCAEAALPRGGQISTRHRDGGWEIVAEGPRLRYAPALWDALEQAARPGGAPTDGPAGGTGGMAAATASAEVQFPLAALSAAALGRPVRVTRGETRLTLAF